jgi:hypothetical protein
LRGASAPLRRLLPLDKRGVKEGQCPSLKSLPLLKQGIIRGRKISLFERGIKGVSLNIVLNVAKTMKNNVKYET